jgi:long-chain acyl-CoA synthetase
MDIFNILGHIFCCLIIYPFLYLISIIDYIIGLILPYNYQNKHLYPDRNAVLSEQVDKSDPNSPWRSTLARDLFHIENQNANVYDEFLNNYKKFANAGVRTLGIREVLSINDELQPNGKIFKKFSLSDDYKWTSYQDVLDRINNISNGLLKIGLKSNQNVVLFAETRPEWLLTAFSCFRYLYLELFD